MKEIFIIYLVSILLCALSIKFMFWQKKIDTTDLNAFPEWVWWSICLVPILNTILWLSILKLIVLRIFKRIFNL